MQNWLTCVRCVKLNNKRKRSLSVEDKACPLKKVGRLLKSYSMVS